MAERLALSPPVTKVGRIFSPYFQRLGVNGPNILQAPGLS
jgi:hypothetical protein